MLIDFNLISGQKTVLLARRRSDHPASISVVSALPLTSSTEATATAMLQSDRTWKHRKARRYPFTCAIEFKLRNLKFYMRI